LDALSATGSTVLSCCVKQLLLNEARALLLAGADPRLAGSPERSPLAQIKRHTDQLSAYIQGEFAKGDLLSTTAEYERLQVLIEFEDYLETFIRAAEKKQKLSTSTR